MIEFSSLSDWKYLGYLVKNFINLFIIKWILTDTDPCATNPCQNGGLCQVSGTTYTCICQNGYSGQNCQSFISTACSSNPCYNGATCISANNGYTCVCQTGYSGSNCQQASTSPPVTTTCTYNACFNGGTCTRNSLNLESCQCQTGYTGTKCQYQSSCATSPCQNGATCQSTSTGSYYCQCTTNYYGKNCEYAISTQLCSVGDQDPTSCQNWSYNGFCSFAYMAGSVPVPVYCPSSCSICKSTCTDSQTNCVIWKEMGFCTRINNLDPNLCKYSCGNCQ